MSSNSESFWYCQKAWERGHRHRRKFSKIFNKYIEILWRTVFNLRIPRDYHTKLDVVWSGLPARFEYFCVDFEKILGNLFRGIKSGRSTVHVAKPICHQVDPECGWMPYLKPSWPDLAALPIPNIWSTLTGNGSVSQSPPRAKSSHSKGNVFSNQITANKTLAALRTSMGIFFPRFSLVRQRDPKICMAIPTGCKTKKRNESIGLVAPHIV